MKYYFVFVFLLTACKTQKSIDFEIGLPLSDKSKILENSIIQTSVNGFSNGKKILYNNITYSVFLDSNLMLRRIITFDKKLLNEDSVKVGSPYKIIAEKGYKKKFIDGWGYEVYLNSGWIAFYSNNNILECKKNR